MTAHFEAKKHAYRQTQDGVVISFVVHPDDIRPEIAAAPLGTHYMIALVKIGEDGQPESVPTKAELTPKPEKKPSKPFHTLPLSQQAALRCNDEKFCAFMAAKFDFSAYDTDVIANAVRYECHVKSRSEFDTDADAARFWKKLDAEFSAWLTDQQYADSMR